MPTIDILANTREAQRNVKDLSKALDDVGDALDDIAQDSDHSADKVEASFRDMQRASSRLENETKSTAREIASQYQKAYKSAEDDAKQASRRMADAADDSGRKMSKATGEFKSEALQNFSEVTSSFTGDMTSAVDLVQGTFGGLASGLGGPLGLAAGAAAALFGTVAGYWQDQQREAELAGEAAAGWADKFIESGQRVVDAAQIAAEVQAIATDAERYKQAGENAKNWGIDVHTAMLAMAGDTTALTVAQDTLNKRSDEYAAALERVSKESGNASYEKSGLTATELELGHQLDAGRDAMDKQTAAMESGRDAAANVSAALIDMIRSAETATKETDELGNAVYTLPGGKQIMIEADTGQATTNLDAFKGDLDGVAETVATATVRVEVDDSAWRYYQPGTKHGGIVVDSWGGSDGTSWQ